MNEVAYFAEIRVASNSLMKFGIMTRGSLLTSLPQAEDSITYVWLVDTDMNSSTGQPHRLASRIKELKARQDELFKSRVLLEADMTIHGVQYVDADQIKSYCSDLRGLLCDTDIVRSKSFLRSFVEKVVIEGSECTIRYKLPVPATWQKSEDLVLPIEPLSGPNVTFAKPGETFFELTVISAPPTGGRYGNRV